MLAPSCPSRVAAIGATRRHHAGMPDQAVGVRGHRQIPVPARILGTRGAPVPRKLHWCRYRVISRNGALFATYLCVTPRGYAEANPRHPDDVFGSRTQRVQARIAQLGTNPQVGALTPGNH